LHAVDAKIDRRKMAFSKANFLVSVDIILFRSLSIHTRYFLIPTSLNVLNSEFHFNVSLLLNPPNQASAFH
jgi:hypothetical protein